MMKWVIERFPRWSADCNYYLHRADATLTDQVNNQGRKFESKLMNFTPQSAEGVDIEPWLPWNYLARRNKAA